MKVVLVLAVLTIFVLLPEGGDAGWWRDKWNGFKSKVKSGWRKLKEKVRNGRRDVNDVDIDQDGSIDLSELEAVVGERHARDIWNFMEAGDSMTLDEFERNARELDDLEDDVE